MEVRFRVSNVDTTNMGWKTKAACRGMDTSLFYPADDKVDPETRRVCLSCPVREECLAYAGPNEKDGYWNSTEKERRTIRRKQQQAKRLSREA